MLQIARPEFAALTFDCYGTLIDWETGIADALRPWRTRVGLTLSDEELLAHYAEIEARREAATPGALYPEILRGCLADLAEELSADAGRDLDVMPAELDAFGRSVQHWPSFPDSPAALAYLQQHYKLVILSNIDRASFAPSEQRLGVKFDLVVTAEEVGSYKPNPRHFEVAFERLAEMGIARERILHVAQSLFHDHVPAKQLGMKTVWINRRAGKSGPGATRPPEVSVEPDLVMTDLAGLAALHRSETRR